MLNKALIPSIRKTRGQFLTQPLDAIHFPQQQAPPIAGKMPSAKISLHFPTSQPLKFERQLFIVCHRLCLCMLVAFALILKD